VINQQDEEVSLKISSKGRKLVQQTVTQTRWTSPKDVEGFVKKIPVNSPNAISSVIPPKSVCCFEIFLKR